MNRQGFQKVREIMGDSAEDTRLLRAMAKEAEAYIASFPWCPKIITQYLGYGIGGIVGIFYFEFATKISGTDDKLWVVVGDLPSAYLVAEPDDSPGRALQRYIDLMQDWTTAVLESDDLQAQFPVTAEPTEENAELLSKRLKFLRAEVLPNIAGD